MVNDTNDFGNSWLATNLSTELNINNEKCTLQPEKECVTSPSDVDRCDEILNSERFGQCHRVVDPEPYLALCRQSVCDGADICDNLEAYARSCLQAGLCPNWRTDEICPYNCSSR